MLLQRKPDPGSPEIIITKYIICKDKFKQGRKIERGRGRERDAYASSIQLVKRTRSGRFARARPLASQLGREHVSRRVTPRRNSDFITGPYGHVEQHLHAESASDARALLEIRSSLSTRSAVSSVSSLPAALFPFFFFSLPRRILPRLKSVQRHDGRTVHLASVSHSRDYDNSRAFTLRLIVTSFPTLSIRIALSAAMRGGNSASTPRTWNGMFCDGVYRCRYRIRGTFEKKRERKIRKGKKNTFRRTARPLKNRFFFFKREIARRFAFVDSTKFLLSPLHLCDAMIAARRPEITNSVP